MAWQTEHLKYLGIIIPKDFVKLSDCNYSPINKKIKEDIARWNLIPFLSFSSRIESIKMNILPRLLYLFQTLPIEIDQKQFNEWDKILSRYIWQGKRPRIRLKTLQLVKEKGGWGLPSLKDYCYWAAQLRPMICWCNPSYDAQWKNMEERIPSIPIQAIIADSNLQSYINIIENPWVKLTLKIWKNVITEYKLEEDIAILKWCAYDTGLTPNKLDNRFKIWAAKGLTVLCNIMKEETLLSFDMLKEKFLLEKQDFYRYLQVRHYVHKKVKNITQPRSGLIEIFTKAYNSNTVRIISCMYKGLLTLKKHSTLYVKTKWEKEAEMIISEEEWTTIWLYQWKCTSSQNWREFSWRSLIRYFITPSRKSHYDGNSPACWRNCGNLNAHHYHVFWDCPVILDYWREIHDALQDIFRCHVPLESKTLFFGLMPQEWLKRDKYLLNILLVAGKKALTRKWLSQESPTLNTWMDITMDIYKMEKITAYVNHKLELFVSRWDNWVNYVTPHRPDFIFTNL